MSRVIVAGPTTGPRKVWPGEYVSLRSADATGRTSRRSGWWRCTHSVDATITQAAPSSTGHAIIAVSGSDTICDASTSSTVTVWSGWRSLHGQRAPWFQFLAAMAAKVSRVVP